MFRMLFVLVLVLIYQVVYSQNDLKFERYTTNDGLPANYVLDICQDHKGFVWFGIRGTCCRFDGFRFETFPVVTNHGTEELQAWISNIVVDQKNRIWVGEAAKYGILFFDYDNEVFINYFGKLNLPEHIKEIVVVSLYCDSKGWLWIGTVENGMILFNPDTGETILLTNDPKGSNTISTGSCLSIMEESNGMMWIGTTEQLCRYDRDAEKWTYYSISGIASIIEDSEKTIWIASGLEGGVHKYNRGKDNFEDYFFKESHPLSSISFCKSIFEDTEKKLWFGTNNGLYVTDPYKKTLIRYNYDENDPETINSNMIKKIKSDATKNIWICTSEGVCKMKKQHFTAYKYSANKNSISQNKVHTLYEDQQNKIWISIPKGIDVFDRTTGVFTFLIARGSSNKELNRSPNVFYEDVGKGIWVGTYMGGLNYYDYSTGLISYYMHDPLNPESLSNDVIFTLLNDSEDNLWVGTFGSGLDLFDRNTGTFKHFTSKENDKNSLPSNYIRKLHMDEKKQIWVGGRGGIAKIVDVHNGIFKRIELENFLSTDKNKIVFDFLDTRQAENIWIATEVGLFQYHEPTQKVVKYSRKDGLPSLNILGLLEDNKGNIWISTNQGLVTAEVNYDTIPSIIKVKTYKNADGLQSDEFLPTSRCKLMDGTMLFGGIGGFSMFHPDSIKDDPHKPKLAFTKFEVSNKLVNIGEDLNGQVILTKSITNTSELVLNYKNNNFSIHFAALHFNQSTRNQYLYFLEGFDTEWHKTGATERKATYMNLPDGTYIFNVKAANCDGVWNDVSTSLTIHILPPWWRTLWFTIASASLILILIVSFIKVRTYSLLNQKIKLEAIVAKRTSELHEVNVILGERKEELEQQMDEMAKMKDEVEKMAKQVHEADQSKLRFFANISHEFRTPLSLIIGPVQKYLQIKKLNNLDEWGNVYAHLQLIERNAKRLVKLVNQTIEFRKIDQGLKKFQPTQNDIIGFIDEIIDTFKPMAKEKSVKIEEVIRREVFGVSEEREEGVSDQVLNDSKQPGFSKLTTNDYELPINNQKLITNFFFDPDIMEKILYNLFSNAIKYTLEGGKILITIDTTVKMHDRVSLSDAQLVIKIADTGIGIEPENLDKIFDRFYRVESKSNMQNEGTGIGLAYTKELVKLHNGDISVESTPGKGTTFTLKFPFNHLDPKYVVEIQNKKPNLAVISNAVVEDQNESTPSHQDLEVVAKKTILLVEDNTDLRNFIKKELNKRYKVIEAENGELGLDKAIQLNPDLVISDIMMPVMDGIELSNKMKTNDETSHIPIILLTAKSGEADILHGLNIGVDDYIVKPFSLPILMAKVRNTLYIRDKLREKFNNSPLDVQHKVATNYADERFLKKATDFVLENLSNQKFTNDEFVQLMGMSKSTVYLKLKALTNQSLSEFIRTIRLKTAAKLLLEGNLNVKEVSYSVGFKFRENFTTYFSALFGQSPSEYIKNNSFS